MLNTSRFRSCCLLLLGGLFCWQTLSSQETRRPPQQNAPSDLLAQYGISGDGEVDDTAAIQQAVDAGAGLIQLPKGIYRLTAPLEIDLDRVGVTSLQGGGVARLVMDGAGPAIRFKGTHEGTAAPHTVKDNVWENQRMPLVDGIEIVGRHAEACGIEASGTMQLTLTRVTVRDCLHAVHLVKRNRNVIVSECHLYENRGVGLFLDHLNLHQINVANCHISYNAGGGVVSRNSEIRNLHIGTCDIEGNMGEAEDPATANVWLDSTDSSLGEVAIVGCTIQHTHAAKNSANIRIDGNSVPVRGTDENRHGNITISDNVLSDVQINIDIQNCRAVTVTGNTLWKGYRHDLVLKNCSHFILSGNVFDRSPRYHYGDGADSKHGIVLEDCDGGVITGLHMHGIGDQQAAITFRNCQRLNITNCTILNHDACGFLLEDCRQCRISDCLIDDRTPVENACSVRLVNSADCQLADNLFGLPVLRKE